MTLCQEIHDVVSGTQVIATVPVAHNPQAIGINPATGHVYVGGRNSYEVTVLSGTKVITKLTPARGPSAIGVNPVTGYVYVSLRLDYRRTPSFSVFLPLTLKNKTAGP